MKDGKKSISYSIFYDSLKIVEEKTKEKGLEVWKKALNNVMPSVEVTVGKEITHLFFFDKIRLQLSTLIKK